MERLLEKIENFNKINKKLAFDMKKSVNKKIIL